MTKQKEGPLFGVVQTELRKPRMNDGGGVVEEGQIRFMAGIKLYAADSHKELLDAGAEVRIGTISSQTSCGKPRSGEVLYSGIQRLRMALKPCLSSSSLTLTAESASL
jgi:hypothetical protein